MENKHTHKKLLGFNKTVSFEIGNTIYKDKTIKSWQFDILPSIHIFSTICENGEYTKFFSANWLIFYFNINWIKEEVYGYDE